MFTQTSVTQSSRLRNVFLPRIFDRASPPHQPSVVLSGEQIRGFNEDGFLSLSAISTPDEVAHLRALFDRLLKSKTGFQEGALFDLLNADDPRVANRLLQLMNPVDYAGELRHTIFRRNAFAIAKQLLGEHAQPFFEHAIMKPADCGAPTPWHQDEAYRADPGLQYREISIWMPLQEVTIRNGCMHYIRGSHRGELCTHRPYNNDPRTHALECCDRIDQDRAVACPVPAGGCTIHTGRTLHYAGANELPMARWAYILAFEVPPQRSPTKRRSSWNDERDPADAARRRAWLLRGGFLVYFWRMVNTLWKHPGRSLHRLVRVRRALIRLAITHLPLGLRR
jgi:ectoine hydroxylase-related dioxygenase (phytanoyl-CoA dioxygenase family)